MQVKKQETNQTTDQPMTSFDVENHCMKIIRISVWNFF